jgi:hypothetical protein
LITKDSLWRRIIVKKYIAPNSLLDWIRSEGKSIKNATNHCKAHISTFAVLGDHLAWKVGDGAKIKNGANAIMGCGNMIFLPLDKTQYFQDGGLGIFKSSG